MEPVKQKLDFSAEELENDPVRVFLRVKPSQGPSCLQLGTGSVVEAAAPKDSVSYKTEARLGCRADHRFTFSTVFAPETSQKNVFDETALPALWRFIRGEQAIVFTYGVTNSGKTFTMQGSSRDPGILPRSFDVLYNTIGSQLAEPAQVLKPVKYAGAESCDAATEIAAFENLVSRVNEIPDLSVLRAASSASQSTLQSSTESFTSLLDRATRDATTLSIDSTDEPAAYTVWMSYTEIYNGAVFDLLEQPMVNKRNKINPLKRKHLTVGRDRHGNTYVRNLKRYYVRNSDDAIKVLMVGQQNRQLAATYLNQQSSRSHCVCTIFLVKASSQGSHVSQMSFVDLAGSERTGQAPADKLRFQETSSINKSLMTLRKCISVIRLNQKRSPENIQIVPFRDSKLTEVLKNYFCNPSLVFMMVNVSQDAAIFDETLQVLKFAALAQEVSSGVGWTPRTPWRTPWKTPLSRLNETATTLDASICSCADEDDSYVVNLEDEVESLREALATVRKKYSQLQIDMEQQPSLIRMEIGDEYRDELEAITQRNMERIAEERAIGEKRAQDRLDKQEEHYEKELQEKDDVIEELENVSEELVEKLEKAESVHQKKIAQLEEELRKTKTESAQCVEDIRAFAEDLEEKLKKAESDHQSKTAQLEQELRKTKDELARCAEDLCAAKEKTKERKKRFAELENAKEEEWKRWSEALQEKERKLQEESTEVDERSRQLEKEKEAFEEEMGKWGKRANEKTQKKKRMVIAPVDTSESEEDDVTHHDTFVEKTDVAPKENTRCQLVVEKLSYAAAVAASSFVVNELDASKHMEVDATPPVARKKVKGKKRGGKPNPVSPQKKSKAYEEDVEEEETMTKKRGKLRNLRNVLSPMKDKVMKAFSPGRKEPEKKTKKLFTKEQISGPLNLLQPDDELPRRYCLRDRRK